MSEFALIEPLVCPGRIGPVRVTVCRDDCVELHTPGELGWGKAFLGLIPIVWAAAAWTVCLRDHLLDQRLKGCIALTLMSIVSAYLMISSLGIAWRFDAKRNRITRRQGLFARTLNPRAFTALRLDLTKVGKLSEVHLKLALIDSTNTPAREIARWNRRETDKTQVEALAGHIRQMMRLA